MTNLLKNSVYYTVTFPGLNIGWLFFTCLFTWYRDYEIQADAVPQLSLNNPFPNILTTK